MFPCYWFFPILYRMTRTCLTHMPIYSDKANTNNLICFMSSMYEFYFASLFHRRKHAVIYTGVHSDFASFAQWLIFLH